ncbi:transcriptional regulator family: C2H2 zinc finger [Agaricus bisporus var. burnettii]|uniref:Transcriptional regulator family: C2H2 zinc finger n=1 Tax=Agaricus bisporus var. burnettii TaxID=192524 RepID=A0A8H7FBC6_AGABI|nr:transcriptional regulator family: C2H2 zinc finger [Agaricus bisporus var. burnettii]
MTDSSLSTPGFEPYPMDYKQSGFDFLFQNVDTLPSHPDLGEFESEIDSSLAGFEGPEHLQYLVQNDYSFLKPGSGPLSAFTDSAYESSSTHSESAYNPPSPNSGSTYSYAGSTYSSAIELENMALDFQAVCVDDNYATQSSITGHDSVDPTSFGPLPPTPPRSPPTHITAAKPYARAAYSDYGPPRRNSMASGMYPQITFNTAPLGAHDTVSPINISSQLPQIQQPVIQSRSMVDQQKADPRKKYKCSHCPRAFARAYNLKTHKATHDPNRLKPHVCHHRSCGRSFSRKHDLGRHLVSIHRDESTLIDPPSPVKSIIAHLVIATMSSKLALAAHMNVSN